MGRGGIHKNNLKQQFACVPVNPSVEDSLRVLQEQVATLQKELQTKNEYQIAEEPKNWQPAKRMVAWQPMKRNIDDRAPLLHAIEARLSEVLRAGERLGVSADDVLADLRVRNTIN